MRVYKPQVTKPLPEGAEIFTNKGKKLVRFKTKRGKTIEGHLTKSGDRVRTECTRWCIEFQDNLDISRRITAFTNEQASRQLAGKIEWLLSLQGQPLPNELNRWLGNLPLRIRDKLVEFGILDGTLTTAGKKLNEFIDEFGEYLTTKERTAQHIKNSVKTLKRIFKACEFTTWTDISASRLKNYLDELRDGGDGISKVTYNLRLASAKQFCRWMTEVKKAATHSPLECLKGLDRPDTDKRRPPRALGLEDFIKFLTAAKNAQARFGLTGYQRYLVYRLAGEVGLRACEIGRLSVKDVDIKNLTITIEATSSKHRETDVLPLRSGLAVELEDYVANKTPSTKVFGDWAYSKAAKMVKKDLEAAKIPYIVNGEYFHFHAIRHTFCTLLARDPNISESVKRSLTRHKSAAMFDRYTHIALHDERSAINRLPDFTQPTPKEQKATGTDGKNLPNICFADELMQTTVDSNGQKNLNRPAKTPIGTCGKGNDINSIY